MATLFAEKWVSSVMGRSLRFWKRHGMRSRVTGAFVLAGGVGAGRISEFVSMVSVRFWELFRDVSERHSWICCRCLVAGIVDTWDVKAGTVFRKTCWGVVVRDVMKV